MDQEALRRMLDLSRKMAETRQLSPLLTYAMQEALDLVNAERGFLVLLQDDGSLDFRVKFDREEGPLDSADDQISTSILNEVVRTGEPTLIRDALSNHRFASSDSVIQLRLRSVMAAPLASRGEIIGAIYVENRSAAGIFNEDDLMLLTIFANQAAVSIANAALNDELEARVAARTAELEQAMRQLEQSWIEAVEANRLRTELFGNVAHDLRAPLTIILSALDMLGEGLWGELNDDQLEWINKARDATRHAIALTADMFDLTRVDMGQLELERQPVELSPFLAKVYKVGKALPWPEAVSFQADFPPDLPQVSLDETRIRQVILNLLTNALKFTREGSVTLYAHPLEDEDGVLIGVVDTGVGIPEDKTERIFERFYQLNNELVRSRKGAGLGLAICRDLVEMHGGRIWVESYEGEGANFKFVLPLG
ncbi:MAG TPA: sensor histidine kinase [Chloroflexi bacterium]|nr:sensor histidine kinase [Chloroflexota bacterium]